MKHIITILLVIVSFDLNASDVPIIFIHGHKSEAVPIDTIWDNGQIVGFKGGWTTWYPMKPDGSLKFPTAMTRIIGYGGYRWGLTSDGSPAKFCDETTELMSNQGTKRIFNFSYYSLDGRSGVIGLTEDTVKVYLYSAYIEYRPPAPETSIYKTQIVVFLPYQSGYPPDTTNPLPPPPPPSNNNYEIYIIQWNWTVKWWPRYTPLSYAASYSSSWHSGRYAKRLAEFIDKVLAATGASQVDIVAHSMGGLVARVAIKNYGCSSKVRKLIMVGTPNHPFDHWWEWFYEVFTDDKGWQKEGEDLEMGVGENADFTDLNTGETIGWHDFLGYDNYVEAMSTIAGNKGRSDWFYGEANDGVVAVSQVSLLSARFNPKIYASHSYGGTLEEALTTCTYTTEFIKMWLIDDEEVLNAPVPENVRPYNSFPPGCIRMGVDGVDYDNILMVKAALYEGYSGRRVGPIRLFPLYRYERAYPGDPVYSITRPEANGNYRFWIEVYDMNHGEVCHKFGSPTLIFSGAGASIDLMSPFNGIYAVGQRLLINWVANDSAIYTKIYLRKIGESGEHLIDIVDGSVRSYEWYIPVLSSTPQNINCRIRVRYYLDITRFIQDSSQVFTIAIPSWKPKNLQAQAIGEDRIRLTWENYARFDYDSIQVFRKPDVNGINQFGKLKKLSGTSTGYVDNNVEWYVEYAYKVRACRDGICSEFTDAALATTTNILNRPTITSLTFQDSVVVIEWNDNSRKNKDYYVGKKVSGRVAGTGHDTTFWYHMGHYPGDATSFIDTFPIEGENIYRVAAIDSTWTGIPTTEKNGLTRKKKTGYNTYIGIMALVFTFVARLRKVC